jgi:hypothetical protein
MMMQDEKQATFEGFDFSWQDYYENMPEYDNENLPPPLITATFKFRTQEDFELFNSLLKEHVYKTNKVFDGMQEKIKNRHGFHC